MKLEQQCKVFEVHTGEVLKNNGDFFQKRMRKIIKYVEFKYSCDLAIKGKPEEIKKAFEKIAEHLKVYSCGETISDITISKEAEPEDPKRHVFLISRKDYILNNFKIFNKEIGGWVAPESNAN